MRLDKFICASTGLSRKEAGRIIRAEEIEIDGAVCKKSATVVTTDNDITWLGQSLNIIGHRYIMLNKPAGSVSGRGDPNHPSVFMLLDEPKAEDIHCVGRLDVDTTGILLLTDDGKWSHRITSPKKQCGKTYRASLAEPITDEAINKLSSGVMLNNEKSPTLPAQVEQLSATEIKLSITEGRYHQVKRMLAAVGNKVVSLHRESIGELTLDVDLEAGEYRYLTEAEIALFN